MKARMQPPALRGSKLKSALWMLTPVGQGGFPSNCVSCQGVWYLQGVPLAMMALQMVSNLRMRATSATFLRLPLATRRWRRAEDGVVAHPQCR